MLSPAKSAILIKEKWNKAWFDPKEKAPVLLAEFQKWENEAEAKEKAANLFIASHGLPKPAKVLLLCLWSLDGQMPSSTAFDIFHALPVAGGLDVRCPSGSKLVVLHALFGKENEYFHFRSFRRIR